MRKGLGKKTARLFLTYVCSVSCFVLLALGCIRITLVNPNFMSRQMEDPQYIKLVQQEINEKIQDIGRGSNVPADQLADIVPFKLVEKNIGKYVKNLYRKKNFSLEGQLEIKEKIHQRLNHYIQEKNIPIDQSNPQVIDKIADSSVIASKNLIKIPYLVNYVNKVLQFKPVLNRLLIGSSVVFILLFFLLLQTIDWTHRKFRFAAYVFLGTGATFLLFPTWLYFSGVIERIGILTESVYRFVRQYLVSFDLTFIYTGLISVGIASILYVFSERKRAIVIYKGRGK